MKPILQITLIPDCSCHFCGAVGYVDDKQMLCCACLAVQLVLQSRAIEARQSRLGRVFGRVLAAARECGLIKGAA